MNKHITEKNLEGEALLEFTSKAQVLDDLYHRVGELEDTIEALDKDIDFALSIGLDDCVNQMCESRNRLNLVRLDLDIKVHELELELDNFEKVRMHTK